ncbi:LemA family protein [Hahella ganghwensis]|uniref:LemA family protein n=1 Tax=Hahella ganghwensis TaxID=286420 RepID=UPI00036E3226|nr:LemA family protein [Hahella ganghwensis]
MHGIFKRIIFAALAFIAAALSVFVLQMGLSDIRAVWQLECIASAPMMAILEGEAILTGSTQSSGKTLQPRLSSNGALYYRYLHEEERGSGDDKRWVTIEDTQRAVDFIVTDGIEDVRVKAREALSVIDWEVDIATRKSQGDHRYTEWALYPGQSLTAIGWMQRHSGQGQLSFLEFGQYRPIISRASPTDVIQDIGKGGLLWVFAGLALLCLSLYLLTLAVQLHRLIAYLFILVLVLDLVLLYLGVNLIRADLADVQNRWQQQVHTMNRYLEQLSSAKGLSSSNRSLEQYDQLTAVLDEYDRGRLEAVVDYLQKTYLRSNHYLARTPFNWFAALENIHLEWPEYLPYDETLSISPVPAGKVDIPYIAAVAGGGVLLVLMTWLGLKTVRQKRCIENIPTSPVAGMTWGLNEVTGKVVLPGGEPLKGPLSDCDCVWFRYREYERVGSGKNKRWQLRTDQQEDMPFLLKDKSGEVKVMPARAEIITEHKETRTEGSWRFVEESVRMGDQVYLLGNADVASTDEQPVQLEVKADPAEGGLPYILSNLTEQGVMLYKARRGLGLLTIAVAACIAVALFMQALSGDFAPHHFLTTASVAAGYLLVLTIIMHYNDLVFLRQRVRRNAANIEVALQRRFDLINNLVRTVNAYGKHEKALMERITLNRAELQQQVRQANMAQWSEKEKAMASDIRVLAEQYPELKQQKLMSRFMTTLESQETYVSLMKDGYNDAVETYLSRIESFPDVILARMCKFQKEAFTAV